MILFGAPHRYWQGPDAITKLGEVVKPFGRVLVVGDAFVLDLIGARLRNILHDSGVPFDERAYAGEITREAIADLDASFPAGGGIVVGLGGGKALDAAKGVAVLRDLPVVTVPTIASNDSPTSAAYAVYDDNHVMVAVDRMPRSPEAVIVDTTLIASAPAMFLLAGIGDAISKKFEADGCMAGTGVTPFGTRPSITAIAIADCCYRTLRTHAEPAMEALKRKQPDAHLEAVVEATALMSGLGFENGGLSIAHSLTRGLVKARDAKNAIHGFHVAWGLLVQLALEDRADAEIADLAAFYRRIGLPVSLRGLGMNDATDPEWGDIARWTMAAPHLKNFGRAVTEDGVHAAIARIEAMAAD